MGSDFLHYLFFFFSIISFTHYTGVEYTDEADHWYYIVKVETSNLGKGQSRYVDNDRHIE